MAFTAREVIEESRDQHPSFDPKRSPDVAAFRRLNRYIRQLTFLVMEKDSSALPNTVLSITLPLVDFDAGYILPDNVYVQGGSVILAQNPLWKEALNLVPYRNRFSPNMYTAAYIHGGVLYLCGNEHDWVGYSQIDLSYIPEPTPLADLDTAVPLPDGAFYPCIEHLAWWMARRQGVYEGVPLQVRDFHAAWKDSEREFLVEIAQHSRPEQAHIREEW